MSDDAVPYILEVRVLSLYEQMTALLERAEGLVQDDGRVTGESDARALREINMKLRALTLEVDRALSESRIAGATST